MIELSWLVFCYQNLLVNDVKDSRQALLFERSLVIGGVKI